MRTIRDPEELLREFGITRPDQIDLEAIAWTQNARVQYRQLHGCEARIIGAENRAKISLKPDGNPRRRRFSLAHEIGHWQCHRGQTLMCQADDIETGSALGKLPERAADRFAAQLLMPEFLIRESLRGYNNRFDMKTIRAMADDFDMSLTAAAIRLIERNTVPSLLVCHTPRGRKWFTRSPIVGHRWFPMEQLDKDSLAFDVLFNEGADDKFLRSSGADAWFDHPFADDMPIKEQTVRIFDDQVLTLLVVEDERMLAD
jgi:IrrE N-terminal-like domain